MGINGTPNFKPSFGLKIKNDISVTAGVIFFPVITGAHPKGLVFNGKSKTP